MTVATRKLIGATLPLAFVGSLGLAAYAVPITPYDSGNPRAPRTSAEMVAARETTAGVNADRVRRNELADEVKAGTMSFAEAACVDRHGEWREGYCERTPPLPPAWLSRS